MFFYILFIQSNIILCIQFNDFCLQFLATLSFFDLSCLIFYLSSFVNCLFYSIHLFPFYLFHCFTPLLQPARLFK